MAPKVLLLALLASLTVSTGWFSPPPKGATRSGTGGMPFSRLLAPELIAGEVVELQPAGSYLYVQLREPGGGSLWVATLASDLSLGPAEVTVYGWRDAFVSRRLERTFDRLAFGVVHPSPSPRRP